MPMQLVKIDHIGVAVASLDDARKVWEGKLGLAAKGVEEVATQKVRVAFLPLAGVKFELLEATDPASPIAKHVAKRGEGLHHVAFEVPDIHAAMADMKARGVAALNPEPGRGAGGKWVCFFHPRDTGGVLVEFVQPP
jgi:methylmalonyl-CoA/ethylmalonyl-CoA epimerase